jgi:ribonucleoside-diphosphate reductase beta chain
MINQNVKDDYRFKEIASECAKEAKDMLESVVAEEKAWAHYQFQKGTVLGMNEKIMCSQVDYTAQERFKAVGVKYDAGIKSAPLPWMSKHLNTNKIQTALQENESTSYVLSSMSNKIDYESLPSI